LTTHTEPKLKTKSEKVPHRNYYDVAYLCSLRNNFINYIFNWHRSFSSQPILD